MALHRDLTGADLHEPKGADTAGAGDVYVFDGSGSGSVQKIGLSSLSPTIQNPNTIYLTSVLEDVSTASHVLVPAPAKTTFDSCVVMLDGAITTSPATISFTRNGVDSLGSALSIPVLDSGEGTAAVFTASSNRDLSLADYVKISSDGSPDGNVRVFLVLKFTRTF